ncbi:MAG: ethyl tert-butyl ether degradation protein EthD [Cycloclasticus sp. symbiont of Bathymodiolus heckerae]|nr:MAG: ethyl tert-butyl ether degradation protein EthD [Cycloclasticus sp. symbiont of Bathymodiolus heckerae]
MCIKRHPKLTREEFKDYWMNKHGPFFMENADAMGAKKYVQSHTLDTPLNEGLRTSRGMLAEYDGVAEVWFESEEALMEGMSSPEGQKLGATLLEDEGNFIDHSKSSAFIVNEHEF